jgi:hypothetical protein
LGSRDGLKTNNAEGKKFQTEPVGGKLQTDLPDSTSSAVSFAALGQ